jgi:hypothetical protein
MRKRLAAIPAMALAFGMLGTTAARATDYPTPEPSGGAQDHSMPGMPGMKMPQSAPPPQQQDVSRDAAIARARQRPFYFAARLSGRNEVPVAGKPAVGDPDGSATGVMRLQGG